MLIGQFCETYPPMLDGVGRVMLSYCQAFEKLGHHAVYIAPENPAHVEDVDCHTLLYRGMGIPGEPYRIGFPWLDGAFRRGVRELPFDVVHAHSPFLAGRAARRIARRRRIPLVATFHSKYYDDFYRVSHSRALATLGIKYVLAFYRTCDEVWAVNHKTADVLRDYGYRGDIVVMPNGTDLCPIPQEDYERLISPYSFREGIPALLFIGQMDFKKNTHSILRACAVLRAQGAEFQLLMVGGGQDAQRLRSLAKELGLEDRVTFTGFIGDRHTLLALQRRADLLVFPSVYDNAPMVVREAAAMGTPSLLIENTCSAEGVTHGENGYLCQNTPESIAQAIVAALPTAGEVGRRAQETIPIPWMNIAQEVLQRYSALRERNRERSVP